MVSEKVTTEKDEQLRDYELILVISPEVTEEEFEASIESVNRYVTDNGGSISETDKWGKKRLAYPIKHFVEGNYVLTKFQLKPELGRQLEVNLRISEEILRHLLVRLDD